MMDRQLLRSTQKKMSRLSKLNRKLSSGRRIHRFSDDIEEAGALLRVKRQKEAVETYGQNLDRAKGIISAASGRLQNMSDVLTRAREITVQAASGTFSDSNLESMAQEIDGVLDQALSNANATYDGKHIFAGRRGSKAAYEATRNAEGQITDVEYTGATESTSVPVAPGRSRRINMVGPDFFQRTNDIFDTLIQIRDAMENGDRKGLRKLVDDLKEGQQGVNTAQAELGAELNSVKMIKNSLKDLSVAKEERIADIADTDMAKVSTEYRRQMNALQAVMKLATKARPTSLAELM